MAPIKKLGLLVSAPPSDPNFTHALCLASEAFQSDIEVYLYLIDEGVVGLPLPSIETLRNNGVKLYACAYSLQKRGLSLKTEATLSGLTLLSDIISATDRFLAFHPSPS